jgi:hypothetical protein
MYNNEKEKKLVEYITDNLNSGVSLKEFCEAMSHEHRTLQGDFTNLCIWWLEKCRDMYEEGNYDGRNVYGCKAGKILMDYYDKGEF